MGEMKVLLIASVVLNVSLLIFIWVATDVYNRRAYDLTDAFVDRDIAERLAIELGELAKSYEAQLAEANRELYLCRNQK